MGKATDITERTFQFALDIVKLPEKISQKSLANHNLLSQVLRSATSIGANIEEGQAAESKADFIHKYCISLKEARETKYWLRLLAAITTDKKVVLHKLITESDEICRIIAQIIINARKNK